MDMKYGYGERRTSLMVLLYYFFTNRWMNEWLDGLIRRF